MNDEILFLGVPVLDVSAPVFVAAGALAIFAYVRAESRARATEDLRWLLASLVLGIVLGLVFRVRPGDGFRGVAWMVVQTVAGFGALGLLEVVAAVATRRRPPPLEAGRGPGAGRAGTLDVVEIRVPRRGRRTIVDRSRCGLSTPSFTPLALRPGSRSWSRARRASSRGSGTMGVRVGAAPHRPA